ncbi:bifunctional UDP-N-acetylglucosamine diphosphorylase/glucosamine-1-phosphate N-acetyltransferase GlmU [Helicobacter aurati]|uniref:Bifunctional protein GlmU n=1 Tax=Helicobacter aurati TaxID=137778 RepID=A0A3D8J542_9HELI|nr:bifunctional UDP-N-acetylglucosamine diphosphorylase/glucosamine-1-phosphate N-acetyltransferase GlmU [Helicobacter aurati]RDU72265.1 bifunctional UDP-N-acetylglucosamine diphosphorylase/glucosamine-1-phosphate N-acetyltransferase GlmU [Helicobacter aurati]
MTSVVILAAGLGTRMRSTVPKVLHKICGKSMLDYTIDTALSVSSDVHVVLFHQEQVIKEHIEQRYPLYLRDKLHFHTQMYAKYPGTGGALIAESSEEHEQVRLLPLQGDRVIVMSGDTPFVDVADLEVLLQSRADICVGIFETNNPYGYGRIITTNSSGNPLCIRQIIEERDCTQEQKQVSLVNGGVYCFQKEILCKYIASLLPNNNQSEYYLTDIIRLAALDGVLIAGHILESEHLLGINSKVELAKAQDIMLDSLRLKAMQQGVIMRMPKSIYIENDVVFEGECILENGVCITGRSIIKDSHIKAHTVIENSSIIKSDIGPNAHIRPSCMITNSHIGNFVECKNANLTGVKAGHLSYLGDCRIDEGSNIGAGVITCNYDGKKKHQTLIGKNVFVGSDCQLVAPLEIQDNVLIAAGSTVTKSAKSGSLVIARQKQTTHENGFFRFFEQDKES